MRFAPDEEQLDLQRTLDRLLARADGPRTARAWADGDPSAGLGLWKQLADFGVLSFAPELPVELVVAFEAIGRHAVPGPYVDAVFLRALNWLPGDGEPVSVAAPPWTPYALDADVASRVLVVADGALHSGEVRERLASVDPTRRLFRVVPGDRLRDVSAAVVSDATDTAVLATSAQLLGLGEALLATSVDHAKQRKQFGRVIGEYQALKHALADVRIALDFARPLVWGAAARAGGLWSREVSAAKVASSDAAYLAARTALQVHGAMGYTAEHDLSLRLLKVRALVGAWGSAGDHRARILSSLLEPVGEA